MLANRSLVVALFICYNVLTFSFTLHMGGGRSPAEKGLSQAQMFKAVRKELNEAALVPGFFDVGEAIVRGLITR